MPPAAVLGAGMLAGAAGGIYGARKKAEAANRAQDLQEEGMAAFRNAKLPEVADQQLKLDMLKRVGNYNPALQDSILQGNTEFDNIEEDPRLRQAQMDALMQLSNISSEGGMDDISKAKMAEARMQTDQQARGQREAILQNAQARGVAGSGLEFALADQANQSAANRNAQAGSQALADAEARRMQAINDVAGLGANIRSQDYGISSNRAASQNAINQFNTQNQNSIAGQNTDRRNDASKYNLGENQRIADTNVGLGNSQQTYNKELLQQRFNNQMEQAKGISGQANSTANTIQAGGEAVGNAIGGLGNAAIGAGANYYANQRPEKKDQYTY